MPTFEEARKTILESVAPLGIERVMLLDAPGRVLAEGISAPWDMPLWDNSAMDGMPSAPPNVATVTLPVTGFIPAGGLAETAVEPGTAMKIMTGARSSGSGHGGAVRRDRRGRRLGQSNGACAARGTYPLSRRGHALR